MWWYVMWCILFWCNVVWCIVLWCIVTALYLIRNSEDCFPTSFDPNFLWSFYYTSRMTRWRKRRVFGWWPRSRREEVLPKIWLVESCNNVSSQLFWMVLYDICMTYIIYFISVLSKYIHFMVASVIGCMISCIMYIGCILVLARVMGAQQRTAENCRTKSLCRQRLGIVMIVVFFSICMFDVSSYASCLYSRNFRLCAGMPCKALVHIIQQMVLGINVKTTSSEKSNHDQLATDYMFFHRS